MPLSRVCFHLLVLCALALAATGGGCKRTATTVDEIIDRNTEARGGRRAIEAVQSLAIDLKIVDPGFAVDGTYRAARPGKMRIDISADGGTAVSSADGWPSM